MVEPGPPVDMTTGQMITGPTQTVVVTSTQPPPQPYPHQTITTLAPLGMVEIETHSIVINYRSLH